MPLTIHLIGNAHLDPVWLWDWREGLNEGIATCQTMVTLLQEFPDARFIRGEMVIYEHIERHAPALFTQIAALVAAGRWEVVGGTYVQADDNLPAGEALLRQFVVGKEYFRQRFGVDVTAAWSADCFGHSAGLPDLLAAAGMTDFAFTRPWGKIAGIDKPAFWWRGASGARVLCYRPLSGWYGTERDEVQRRLDACAAEAAETGLENVACFYGLGNHGGGPSRRQLEQIAAWAGAHSGVRVVHSGLHTLFAAVRREVRRKGADFLPEWRGELNFCLRGCSASVAKFKFQYRRAEAQLFRAERMGALAVAATRRAPESLARPWRGLLFNAFHDILPGTAIERAFDDQVAQLGCVLSEAQRVEHDAVLALAGEIDTRPSAAWETRPDQPEPVPVLVWNSNPYPLSTHIELEVSLDYRPLWQFVKRHADVPAAVRDHEGRLVAAQRIKEEHDSMAEVPWRWRVVVPVELPPFGWRVLHVGLADRLPAPDTTSPVRAMDGHAITNGSFTVAARAGDERVRFSCDGVAWLGEGLAVRVFRDVWGSWGGMNEEPDSFALAQELERWHVDAVQVIESGPERAALWVRFAGARSQLELTFLLARGARHVRVRARVLWNARSARLKLVLPAGGPAEFEVPGGTVRREPCGEVPGGRWVRAGAGDARVGFASDALYGFDTTAEEFRATIVRATRYASDVATSADERPWVPAVDAGELRFNFLLSPEWESLPQLAAELEEPPIVLTVPPRAGHRSGTGSLAVGLDHLRVLALRALDTDRVELRVQNPGAGSRVARLNWFGAVLDLGRVQAAEIVTWRLTRADGAWRAERVAATAPAETARRGGNGSARARKSPQRDQQPTPVPAR